MEVYIYRDTETERSITGRFVINSARVCFELEPARYTPVHVGHPCIPAGRYRVIKTHSPHLGYDTPEVLNVPGRTAIRWHIGNKPEDIKGCSAVGESLGPPADWVAQSKTAFEQLMRVLDSAWSSGEEVFANYFDPITS